MRRLFLVTPEALLQVAQCFSGPEEFETFVGQMAGLLEELSFMGQLESRVDQDAAAIVRLKQICVFTIFCRENMDLLHQLIASTNVREITEEEKRSMGL